MEDLKNRIEAIIFSVGKKIDLEEIAKLCRADVNEVENALKQLQKEYNEKDSALVVLDEGTKWSLTVREKYINLTKRIVADTELSKTMMETLAVIAWKQPMKQSELIRVRTNKAYDHIKELGEMGFISSEKHGRTRLLKLTEKFFNYFEISDGEDIRKIFKGVKEIAEETVKMKEKQKQDRREKKEPEKPPIEDVETYGGREIEEDKEPEMLGKLEVVDEKETPESSKEISKEKKQIFEEEKEKESEESEETEEETTDELIDEELEK